MPMIYQKKQMLYILHFLQTNWPYDWTVNSCDGVFYGLVDDECGVCDGDNSSCRASAGVPNGNAVIDECGILPEITQLVH